MALIRMSGGFAPIPEGIYVFKIVEVEYKEQYGKLAITMQTAKGKKHIERFQLTDKDGHPNDGAMAAFSFLVRAALNDMDLGDGDEIDPEDLVGHYIRATVEHDVRESTKKEGETVTFVKLVDKEPADGFDEDEAPAKKVSAPATEKKKYDLSFLLGKK